MHWVVGITTVPSRFSTYLPRTLASLARAGFPQPRLFVDGGVSCSFLNDGITYEATPRTPAIGAFGNFSLMLHELVMRNPICDRFAVFQDDVVCCANLRQYLDKLRYPKCGYWNLFTYARSERVIQGRAQGWVEGGLLSEEGTDQKGQGALGFVFDRETLLTLIEQPPFVRKPVAASRPTTCVDGAVVGAMNFAGYREYVHGPSLVQHIGIDSAIQIGKHWGTFADSFRGEDWDPNGTG